MCCSARSAGCCVQTRSSSSNSTGTFKRSASCKLPCHECHIYLCFGPVPTIARPNGGPTLVSLYPLSPSLRGIASGGCKGCVADRNRLLQSCFLYSNLTRAHSQCNHSLRLIVYFLVCVRGKMGNQLVEILKEAHIKANKGDFDLRLWLVGIERKCV